MHVASSSFEERRFGSKKKKTFPSPRLQPLIASDVHFAVGWIFAVANFVATSTGTADPLKDTIASHAIHIRRDDFSPEPGGLTSSAAKKKDVVHVHVFVSRYVCVCASVL